MTRTDFLARLEIARPALAGNELVPILTHFWFDAGRVMAFNDMIAISTPCKATDMRCALPGTILIAQLQASRAKEIEVVENDAEDVVIKLASSRLKLRYLKPDQFVFEMPKPRKGTLPVTTKQFLAAVECCMRSVSHDTSMPDQLGVTLIPTPKLLLLFATNGATVSHAQVPWNGKAPDFKRVILSGAFCEQLLKLADKDKALQLEIYDDHALLSAGDTLLFGRLIDSEKPLEFQDLLKREFPPTHKAKLAPIPSKLELILDRAVIIAEAKQPTKTKVSVRDERMRFLTQSERGEVSDIMQVAKQHPDVSVMIDPRQLKHGFDHFDQMLITESCALMTTDQGDMIYMVATSGSG